MRKAPILMTVLIAGLIQWGMAAPAQVVDLENTITTQGQGSVDVKPDSVRVNVSVETQASTLDQARNENNRRMQSVIKALRDTGIPHLVLETGYVNVYPVQGKRDEDRLPKIVGYRAVNSLTAQVSGADPDMLGTYGSRLIDAAMGAGANRVNGLSFYLENMAVARMEALQEAVEDARKNAVAMARAAGVEITGVHSIEGTPQYYPVSRPMPMMAKAAMEADVASTPVETGETQVTSTVTVRFRF